MKRLGRGMAPLMIAVALGLAPGSGVARAGLTLGIMIDQTILMPTGDPHFQFDFKASLVAMNGLTRGDFIVFRNVPDFAGASFTSPFFGNNLFTISNLPVSNGGNDVTFLYTAPLDVSNPGTTNVPLGDFLIATTDDNFDPTHIPPQLLVPIFYQTQTTAIPATTPPTKNLGSGFTPVPTVVPEPASLALIAAGLPVVGLAWSLRRSARRRVG